jgi:GDP-L-fucose synthase
MNELAIPELDLIRQGKIYIAGHRGMVGSALVRRLQAAGCEKLLLKTRSELDLKNQLQVQEFMHSEQPDYVFLAAARVGGIHANNSFPAQFLYDNLMMSANVIHSAYEANVGRLLFLGSSCIYPKFAPQPMPEECLLSGQLEPTNEPYAISKIAGIKLCESYNREYRTDFRSVMPTNLYGTNDNFDLKTSHALPALLRKFHEAKIEDSSFVEVWGSGKPRREFLHVDDLADACLFVMGQSLEAYQSATQERVSFLNVGCGQDVSIAELSDIIREVVQFEGEISYNSSFPDGTPQKLLDVSKLSSIGWNARVGLRDGIATTYKWYLDSIASN